MWTCAEPSFTAGNKLEWRKRREERNVRKNEEQGETDKVSEKTQRRAKITV